MLDVGCGRGEFLDLLAAHGITRARHRSESRDGRGLPRARARRHRGRRRRLSFGVADASLGGIFAAQVVEHLRAGYLLRFLELAFHKLRPGGPLVLETLNPACWVAFFESYIRDITHVWPLHPETLKYLVLASGFSARAIEYRSPVPPQDRLQPIAAGGRRRRPGDVVETFNANVEKLNARIFTYWITRSLPGNRTTCEA